MAHSTLQLKFQLEKFKSSLRDFAKANKKQIKKDPNFRKQFRHLCTMVGIDPLYCKISVFDHPWLRMSYHFLPVFLGGGCCTSFYIE